MLTTFDRYLLNRYLYAVFGMFVAAWGLYVVVDGFTNIDIRGATEKSGPFKFLIQLASYYLYQSTMLFDLTGPTIAVLSVMITLALMLRQGEVHPVLAAGIPTYRLMWPFLIGVMLVNGLLIANQELLIPQIADRLQGPRGETSKVARSVEPQYDPRWIFISGRELIPSERKIGNAEFRLPETLSASKHTLRAETAINYRASGNRPAGWLLKNVQPHPDDLSLTDEGRRILIPRPNGNDLFLICDLTAEQLFKQNTAHKYLSTVELIRRIQRPANTASVSIRGQIMQVHARFTRPVLMLLGMFLAFPLTVRREKDSLIANISLCMGTLGLVFGMWQGGQFLGQSAVMPAELAAWAPLILGGSLSAWLTGILRT